MVVVVLVFFILSISAHCNASDVDVFDDSVIFGMLIIMISTFYS